MGGRLGSVALRLATVAVLLFVIMLVVSLIQFRGLERRVHYG